MNAESLPFDDWIQAGGGRHAEAPDELARELEGEPDRHGGDGARLAMLLKLSNHVVGEHLEDWERARRFAEAACTGIEHDDEASTDAVAALAVARCLAGDALAGLASEARALRLAGSEALACLLRVRAGLVAGLVGARRGAEAAPLWEATLELALLQPRPFAGERALAVAANNLASGLLERDDREACDDRLMRSAAEAARTFWTRCGTWVNGERAEYLLALVENGIGDAAAARGHAERGLALIRQNGAEPVDEAFLELARASALRALGDEAERAGALARADTLAADFDDEGLRAWYAGERAKA